MSTPPAGAGEPLALRLVRGILALALALAVTLIVALIVLGCMTSARQIFEPLFTSERGTARGAMVVAVLFLILLPALLLFWPFVRRLVRGSTPAATGSGPRGAERRGRFRWLGWPMLLTGWVIVLPVLLWLASDDATIHQPITIEEFSPGFPGADRSFAVLMQFSHLHPSPEAAALAAAHLEVTDFKANPSDAAPWTAFVAEHRAGLEQDWKTLEPQRRWLDALAAFDRIGDLTPPDLQADSVALQSWRTLGYHLCAIATLQALDGHGDDAVATLVPLLDVNRKLPLTSRTLLRTMMAEVMERLALQTATLILDRSTVSAPAREKLANALGAENPAIEARRLVMVDFVQFAPIAFSLRLGDAVAPAEGAGSILRVPLNLVGVFVINPHATMNLYGDHVRELAALAEARQLPQLATKGKDFADQVIHRTGIKNLGGRWLMDLSLPAFGRAIEIHWQNADLRATLRQRLAAKA
ncbi:MAG TPA: hypothetical protein VHD32_03190 [Candidatus Didemnitutus sp.]|nr:hypothetical protein [Candidatus Didemnitutus sp.]